jgi:hypothetical protein
MAVGNFRLENSRRAGADEHTDASWTVFLPCSRHRLIKTILAQAQLRNAVIAAIEFAEFRAYRQEHKVGYLAHMGVEPHRLEGAGSKAGSHFAHCLRSRVEPDTGTAGNCVAI